LTSSSNSIKAGRSKWLAWVAVLVTIAGLGFFFWPAATEVRSSTAQSSARVAQPVVARDAKHGGHLARTAPVAPRQGRSEKTVRGTVAGAGTKPVLVCAVCTGGGCEGNKPECIEADARGNYSLTLPTGRYVVRSSSAGLAESAEAAAIDLTDPDSDLAPLSHELEQSATKISGQTVRESGNAVAGATIVVVNARTGQSVVAQSDASGHFDASVAAGRVRLQVYSDETATLVFDATSPADLGAIVLPGPTVVEGNVVIAGDERPVPDARVLAMSTDGQGNRFEAVADADGYFRFSSLAPGGYDLHAFASNAASQQPVRVVVDDGAVVSNVVLPMNAAMQIFATVSVRGQPCVEPQVIAIGDGASSAAIPDGERLRLDGLSPGRYVVTVQCKDMAQQQLELSLSDSDSGRTFAWELEGGERVDGVVAYVDGPMDREVFVQLRQAGAHVEAWTDATGRFSVAGLVAGAASASVRTGPGGALLASEREVSIAGDGQALTLVVEHMPRIVLNCDLREQTAVTFSVVEETTGATSAPASVTADEVVFDGLPVGEYRVFVASAGNAPVPAHAGGAIALVPGNDVRRDCVLPTGSQTIQGRVVDDRDERGVANVLVSALAQGAQNRLPTSGVVEATARTDASGRFEIRGLIEGEFTVTARGNGGAEVSSRVAAPSSDLQLVLPAPAKLVVRPQYPATMSDTRFELALLSSFGSVVTRQVVSADQVQVSLSEVPLGRLTVAMWNDELMAQRDVVMESGDSADVQLELAPREGRPAPTAGAANRTDTGGDVAESML